MSNNKFSGIFKPNNRYETNPRQPYYKGWTTIAGKTFWFSAWWNPNGSGKAGSKLEHEPHFSFVLEEAETPQVPSHHVGGTNFNTTPRASYMGIPAQDTRGAKLSAPIGNPNQGVLPDDEIPF